ncbi:MAG: S8 family serine peptidase [Acidobacteria bacterium]|nr:S8 family serine peptidase [Acidobacteriota bacterium]
MIADRIEALDMMVIDLPVRVAEEVASVQSAKHLSLDTQVQLLGHIEETTGISLVRNQSRTVLNLLGVPVTTNYQLDGAGIGVAVVDSGVYEGHRSFVDALVGDRVVRHVDFTSGGSTSGNSTTNRDPFGHGSHVAGLIGGGKGNATELLQYRSMAPSVNLINVRVLGANGTGTSAGLLQGLEWIYNNRNQYNIKVVNMSLGTPAVDTWRNDPLCRAARRLVDAGIVVVAAAGNNGKNAAGQKLYGAIHSPGNEPSVITVGATNTFGTDARNDDGIATFSSRGPTRSFSTNATTGVRTYDHLIKPDLVAPGNRLISATGRDSQLLDDHPELGVYPTSSNNDELTMMYLSGTSMATPIVSGTAALLRQANPKLTPNMIKMILMYTAQPLTGFNHLEQGAGQLNAEGAVRLANRIRQDMGDNPQPGTPMLTVVRSRRHLRPSRALVSLGPRV